MGSRLLSALCVLALVPQLPAQSAVAAANRAQADPDARTARRLLYATGGGVLREDSRFRDGRWEVRRDGQWTALPEGLIRGVRIENEVLDEWRGLRSKVAKGTAEHRVTLAEWGVEQGLYKEALEQLDAVLEADPDHAGARALLERDDLPIGLPSDRAPLDVAAAAPPALREIAIDRLVAEARQAGPEALQALHDELGRRLLERKPGERAAAALALRRLAAGAEPPVAGFSEAELAELLRRSVRDVSPEVRQQAALALRDAQEEALLLPLFKALGSRSSAIRTHAAQTMAVMGQPRAVEPLVVRLLTLQPSGGDGFSAPRSNIFVGRQIAFVQGFDVEVAQSAAIGKPMVGTLQDGASLDVAVMGVSGGGGGGGGGYGYVQEGEALCQALEQLTGANPGRTKADWQRWWTENRATWGATATTSAGG